MWYRLYHKGIGCIKPIYNLIMTNSNQIMSNWEKSHAIQKFLRPQVPSNKRFWFFVAMRNFLFLHWKSANELKWLILREARQSRIMQLLKRINQAGIRMLARLYDEIPLVLIKSFVKLHKILIFLDKIIIKTIDRFFSIVLIYINQCLV